MTGHLLASQGRPGTPSAKRAAPSSCATAGRSRHATAMPECLSSQQVIDAARSSRGQPRAGTARPLLERPRKNLADRPERL